MNENPNPHRRGRLVAAILVIAVIAAIVLLRGRFFQGSVTTVTPISGPPRTVIAETLSHGQKVTIPANAAGIITCPSTEPPLGSSWRNTLRFRSSSNPGWLRIYEYSPGFSNEQNRTLASSTRWTGPRFGVNFVSSAGGGGGGSLETLAAGKMYYVASSTDFDFSCSSPRPIAWWKMEEGQGLTAVDSVSNHNATIAGASWIAPGATTDSVAALSFDGIDDFLTAANSETLNFDVQNRFSFSFLGNGDKTVLRNFSVSAMPLRGYLLQVVDGYVQLILSEGTNAGMIATSSLPMAEGRYSHVIVSYDGTKANPTDRITMYIDGVHDDGLLTQAFGNLTTFSIPDPTFYIGKGFAFLSDAPFSGNLDDVRIFDTIVDPSDFKYIFPTGSSSSALVLPPPPVTVSQSGPTSAMVGDTVTYTYSLRNNGPQPLTGVTLRNPLPTASSITVNTGGTDASCTVQDRYLVCSPSSPLAGGAQLTLTVSFVLGASTPCPTILSNTGFASATGYRSIPIQTVYTGIACQPIPSSSSSAPPSSSSSSSPPLSVVASGPTTVTAGQTALYSFRVTNVSSAIATNVTLRVPIPASAIMDTAQTMPGCRVQGTDVICGGDNSLVLPGNNNNFSIPIGFTIAQSAQCPVLLSVLGYVSANSISETFSNTVFTGLQCAAPVSSAAVSSSSSSLSSATYTFEPAYALCEPSEWMEAGTDALPRELAAGSAVSHNGKLFVLAGNRYNALTIVAGSGVYMSMNGDTWTFQGFLPHNMQNGIALSYANKLWYIGGATSYNNFAPNEIFPYFSNNISKAVFMSSDEGVTWQRVGDLPDFLAQSAGVVFNGKMWVIAGRNGSSGFSQGAGLKSRKVYSSTDGITWNTEADLPVPLDPQFGNEQYRGLSDHAAVVFNGKIYVVGGYFATPITTTTSRDVFVFDPVTGWTRYQGVLPSNFIDVQLAVFRNKIWSLGGGPSTAPICSNYLSDNGTDWYTAGNNLPYPTTQFSIVTHPFGGGMGLWAIGGQATNTPTTPYEKVLVLSDTGFLPSAPTLTCGNNVLDSGEECDDGNRFDGDGCFSNCSLMSPPFPLP